MTGEDASCRADSERYRPEDRIRKRVDYQRVQRSKRRVHTKHYLLVVAPRRDGDADTGARLGITVTKKVGNAVQRNRVKRVMREVFRRHRELFPEADVVVIAKRGAPSVDYVHALDEVRRVRSALARASAGAPPSGKRR